MREGDERSATGDVHLQEMTLRLRAETVFVLGGWLITEIPSSHTKHTHTHTHTHTHKGVANQLEIPSSHTKHTHTHTHTHTHKGVANQLDGSLN